MLGVSTHRPLVDAEPLGQLAGGVGASALQNLQQGEWARLRDAVGDVVQEPATMPWGNRSLLLRDPDGTLVNLFTPVSAEAIARVS
ncbi:MAG TPA: VOC family protein [Actinoplanes sp.]|nr:VOC family protein [Actinoplanes sp.]